MTHLETQTKKSGVPEVSHEQKERYWFLVGILVFTNFVVSAKFFHQPRNWIFPTLADLM